MLPPPDTAWYVRVGRFLNVLDADLNVLSPVKVQAWVATGQAAAVLVTNFIHQHADAMTTGASLVWAALGHVTHQADKINQSKAAARAAGDPNVRP